MKNPFVNYEISRKLKEKGFNEPCLSLYSSLKSEPEPIMGDWITNDEIKEEWCTAPLYQGVVSWLYDTEGIWITIENNNHTDLPESGFEFYVTVYGFCEIGKSKNKPFNTPKEALDKAIEEALKLI